MSKCEKVQFYKGYEKADTLSMDVGITILLMLSKEQL